MFAALATVVGLVVAAYFAFLSVLKGVAWFAAGFVDDPYAPIEYEPGITSDGDAMTLWERDDPAGFARFKEASDRYDRGY